jgi:hypothetical protein
MGVQKTVGNRAVMAHMLKTEGWCAGWKDRVGAD